MQYLHKRMHLNAGDTVVVDCSHQCNILLMTDSSFNGYRNGGNFEHHGGGGFSRSYLHVCVFRIQATGM